MDLLTRPDTQREIEVLIKEARRLRQRRWVVGMAVAFFVSALVVGILVSVAGSSTSLPSSEVRPLASLPAGGQGVLQQVGFPTHGRYIGLSLVSCESGTSCVVIGDDISPDITERYGHLIAERLAGGSWSTLPSPIHTRGEETTALSCPTTSFCMMGSAFHLLQTGAGGRERAIAEDYRSGTWHLSNVPVPSTAWWSYLSSVDCVSSRWCMAMGVSWYNAKDSTPEQVFADVWNGTRWALLPVPTPFGVASPDLPSVGGLACVTEAWCMAVGNYTTASGRVTMTSQVWDGLSWSQVPVPPRAGSFDQSLASVSCLSSTDCVAAGQWVPARPHELFPSGGPQLLQWNGSQWTSQLTGQVARLADHVDAKGGLNGISCSSTSRCVSFVAVDPSPSHLSFRGAIWSVSTLQTDKRGWFLATKAFKSGLNAEVQGVSCLRDGRCLLVGISARDDADTSQLWHPLVLEAKPR
jgi:hypothetical protein